jgi:hypothetical protein
MTSAFDGGGELFEPVLEALEGLRFDHGAHLCQHPNETAGFGVIEFLGSSRAIDARGLGYEPAERVEGMPDQGSLGDTRLC